MISDPKIDATALAFISNLMDIKARMLETAAKLANETDSNLHRANVMDEIFDSCRYIDSMLARGDKEE